MKLKINTEQQKEISKIRKTIEDHRIAQDEAIEKLAKSMGINPHGVVGSNNDFETLWDYIYNDSEWMVELEQHEKL